MANAADGILGDWLPHKDSCRCADCQLWRLQQRVTGLESTLRSVRANDAAIYDAMIEVDSGIATLAERNCDLIDGLNLWRRQP